MNLKPIQQHAAIRPLLIFFALCQVTVIVALLAANPIVQFALGILATCFGILGFLDAEARIAEYRWIRHYGSDLKIFSTLRRLAPSYCGRGVGIVLYGDTARDFYHGQGYRWWHILPDGFPQVLFKKVFWENVFLGKFGR